MVTTNNPTFDPNSFDPTFFESEETPEGNAIFDPNFFDPTFFVALQPPDPGGVSSLIISITPMGGDYQTSQTVTLTINGPGTIYYTTDGSIPTSSSNKY